MEEAVDSIHILKKISKLLDDARKEADGVVLQLARLAGLEWVVANINKEDVEPIRGRLAVGTPSIRSTVKIPHIKRDREKYLELMKALGVSRQDAELDLVRPYWPAMIEEATERVKVGKPMLPGIDPGETRRIYAVATRTRLGVEL